MGAGVWFLSFCPVESVSKRKFEDGYPMATGEVVSSEHSAQSCSSGGQLASVYSKGLTVKAGTEIQCEGLRLKTHLTAVTITNSLMGKK